ncbi:MAG TPA: fatty acyl-AMP ligase [Pyrinomonadaceae bacterium]|jgi:acyl-CoA synthetase (AMP-forming)/AMP-acid ligase II
MSLTYPVNECLITSERLRLWHEPRAADLIEVLEHPAQRSPELVAIHLCEHAAESEDITYGQLWASAQAIASRLWQAGLQRGERVLLVLPTSREFFANFFGVLVAGGIPVPVAPPTSLRGSKFEAYQEIINNVALDSGATISVCMQRAADALATRLQAVSPSMRLLSADAPATMDATEATDASFAVVRPHATDTALLQYTSGSTSKPKGVVLSHRNIVSNAEAIAQSFVEPDTICVSWLPLYHDMGLIGTCLTALYCRTPVVFMPPQAFIKDPAKWLRCISEFRATSTVAPNFAFSYAAKNLDLEDLSGVRLDSLKTALNGAEPVDVEAVENFYEKFKPLGLRDGVVRPVYGLAESSLAVTFAAPGRFRFDEVDAELLESEGLARLTPATTRRRRLVSVGRPIPTQEVSIVDADGCPLPERHVGEVVVRGPSVMQGYHQRPDETAEVLRDGWLHTGDLGYFSDGELYLTGRLKDLIIRYGKNYYPQDIEKLVCSIGGVLHGGAAAFSVEREGESLVVVVAETRTRKTPEHDAMMRQIRTQCHDFFLFSPDVVRLVAPGTIPRTTSGKIRRRACKQLYLDSLATDAAATDDATS